MCQGCACGNGNGIRVGELGSLVTKEIQREWLMELEPYETKVWNTDQIESINLLNF